jgi:hypothetical protein
MQSSIWRNCGKEIGPYMTANELLEHLITIDDPRLAVLKVALKTSAPVFLDVSTGEGTPLLRIYTIKAGMAKDKGSLTEGYEDLVANLKAAQNRQVTVLHVNLESKAFLVFADAETKHLFGVISGDRK